MFKQIRHIGLLCFTVSLCFSGTLFSQGSLEADKTLSFFMAKAKEDAQFEQNIQLRLEEDEIDFWNDQRNYEKALKKESYTAYQVYVNTKLEAYSIHKQTCNTHCAHSQHYYIQETFYAIHGKKDFMSSKTDNQTITAKTNH